MMIYVSSNSITVGMNEKEATSKDRNLYPNPGKSYFSVGTTNGEEIDGVTIFDVNGKTVLSQKGNAKTVHHNLRTGVYFVEISAGPNVTRKKLLVE
jgi:hypothetical protein